MGGGVTINVVMKNKRYIFKIKLPTAKEKGLCVSVWGGGGLKYQDPFHIWDQKYSYSILDKVTHFLNIGGKKEGGEMSWP